MKNPLNRLDDLSRRELITRMARTCLGVSLVPPVGLARALETSVPTHASHVIYLYMRGGMSHIDTFDTKPDAPDGHQGPVRTIKTKADGLQFSGYFPMLAEHAKKIAVVRSMHHTQGAHEPGVYKVLTGFEMSASMRHPALGAWVARQVTQGHGTLPPYIRLAGLAGHPGAGFMDARYAPVPVLDAAKGLEHTQLQNGDSMTNLRKRSGLAEKLNSDFLSRYPMADVKAHADVYADAIKLMTSKDLEAFDLTQEKSRTLEEYGGDYFGQGLLLARRLVEHGTKFVEIELGGWDTHEDNFAKVEYNASRVDYGVSTLLADLEARGLLESTLVVLTTEFGRTPKIEKTGRGHHPIAFSSFIAGGGVKGGQAYGKTDETGTHVIENPVTVLDFHATIGALLGIPAQETISGGGGSFSIYGGTGAKRGVPIAALV
ncbi:DUF1501 domain-containing protein [Prosthecobacter sp.]|uniref:DUF1501 domain-containing protein n=1 Tax=Prosthecobacter sp. TaxID=1965333 RepID=UPI00378466C7